MPTAAKAGPDVGRMNKQLTAGNIATNIIGEIPRAKPNGIMARVVAPWLESKADMIANTKANNTGTCCAKPPATSMNVALLAWMKESDIQAIPNTAPRETTQAVITGLLTMRLTFGLHKRLIKAPAASMTASITPTC